MPNKLAFDRASVRSVDVNGRMHVELTNISMAAVNPYFGKEIPGFKELGLEPDRVYQLLRDPGELAKAAASSNSQPLLCIHEPIFPTKPEQMLVIGTTGTDAKFEHPYLKNSLAVWTAEGIKAIESKEKCELSSSYFYTPDMMPGTYEGVAYDGVMRNISFNHIAIVSEGRAGPTVLVSDANPFSTFKPLEKIHMKNPQRVARQSAALAVALSPLLALDTSLKPDEFVKNLALALDAAEPDGDEPTPPKKTAADEQGPDESDDDFKARMAKKKAAEDEDDEAEDEDETDKKPGEKKAAMDAAIHRAGATARAAAVKDFQDIRRAEKEIFPHVGEVAAMDSATAYYKLALDAAKVDLTGVDKSAYGALVRMLPKPSEAKSAPRIMAQDNAAVSGFHERFPTAGKPARSY